ncbi:MAG TPA: ATP-binding protein [Caulobacteraceae bacterium]|jgi:hypothetical protein|nr:ATP-binding protein [Caulobacteraceae bacterium]
MSADDSGYVATSVVSTLLAHMQKSHDRRRIAVFSGPPGIGKSTAIGRFQAAEECKVAVVSVPPGPKGGLKSTAALQLALEAIYEVCPSAHRDTTPTNYVMLRGRMFGVICEWAGFDGSRKQQRESAEQWSPHYTIIFDEAQNLSPEAIEVLRFLNDATGGYSPFPIGLIFVGNNEFILKSDRRGQSVLSAAVADRALYVETLTYADVRDDDLKLFFEAGGLVDPNALQLVIHHFGTGRADRSFRRAADLLSELNIEADRQPVTAELVRDFLFLAA